MTVAISPRKTKPSVRRLTVDQFEAMPDTKGYELNRGLLVELNVGTESAWIAGEMFARLREFVRAHNLGWVLPPEAGYRCFAEDQQTVRKPDASFVPRGRFVDELLPKGFSTVPPALAVEVVSPSDKADQLELKLGQYLQAGVDLIWVLYPVSGAARVLRRQGAPSQLGPNDQLNGEGVLPGFAVRLGDLWPPSPTIPPAAVGIPPAP
jgi:Uma2 family endonuclease